MVEQSDLVSGGVSPRIAFFVKLFPRCTFLPVLVAGRMILPLTLLIAALLLLMLVAPLLFAWEVAPELILSFLLFCAGAAVASLAVGLVRLRNQLLSPLVQLEQLVADVSRGEPWSTLVFESVGLLEPLAKDLDSLGSELIDLYDDMDTRVAQQTKKLGQQTAGLKILYDVAASINQMNDIDELLMRFLRVLRDMIHGTAATVQLVSLEGQMRLVGSLGDQDEILTEGAQLPVHLCQCGRALSSGDVLCEHDGECCLSADHQHMYTTDEMEMVTIPLKFQGETLGLYRIYVKKPNLKGREDVLDLLSTIGSHLGIAIAKYRSDDETHRLSIIEERTTLAHELHDSLAQTLASLRFQVRMLDETLENEESPPAVRSELDRIKNGIDEAHTELRELLNNFRAPIDQRGLEPALEELVRRFRQETGVSIFFQRGCRQFNLNASEEMQLLRIVQECLANIRKHAEAHTVRILVTCKPDGEYRLLVEDDGVGFNSASRGGEAGEHIGLSIMEERARRLGGTIRIESEPGEGTRVELFYHTKASRKIELQELV